MFSRCTVEPQTPPSQCQSITESSQFSKSFPQIDKLISGPLLPIQATFISPPLRTTSCLPGSPKQGFPRDIFPGRLSQVLSVFCFINHCTSAIIILITLHSFQVMLVVSLLGGLPTDKVQSHSPHIKPQGSQSNLLSLFPHV